MTTNRLAQLLCDCSQLPSLPSVAVQVLDLARRPDAGIDQIAALIARDSALTARLLKTANSSFYGRSRPVVTISQAVVTLGLQSVKTLVLGFSLVRSLSRAKSNGFNHLDYWRHSVYSATAAKVLAAKAGVVQQEEAFLAALLMDIGMLAFDQVLGKPYGAVVAAAGGHDDLPAAERAAYGMTHAEAGGILAGQWKLPPVLAEPIRHHHDPSAVDDPDLRQITELVALGRRVADVFADAAGTDAADAGAAGAIADVRRQCLGRFRMTAPECDAMLDEIGHRTGEFSELFQIKIGTRQSYEQVLRRANEALVEMTLQSHVEATAMAERATALAEQATTLAAKADSLAELNRQLRRTADTDALTALANRGRFDAFLADAVGKARAGGRAVSVVLIDLDHFKAINDARGHAAGDEVLRRVAEVVAHHARPQDLAARYGGEELALVLPNTRRATAVATAETLRAAVAALRVKFDGKAVPVTASLGVAGCDGADPLPADPTELVARADAALYAAKEGGRNRVREAEAATARAA